MDWSPYKIAFHGRGGAGKCERWGGEGGVGGVGGVGHGLEPVKHCFSWQALEGEGASASGGGGEGSAGGVAVSGGGWRIGARKILLVMARAVEG